MKKVTVILEFIKRVISKAFSGILKFLSVFDFISFLLHLVVEFPFWISTAIAGGILMISFFLVWQEEYYKNTKLNKQLERMRSQTPKYEVTIETISSGFSIQPKIEEAINMLKTAKEEADGKNFLQGFLGGVSQVGFENPEDEISRLSGYVRELKNYEKRINHIYAFKVFILADKNDENVEIDFSIPDGTIIIEDDFVENNIPTTANPNAYWNLTPKNIPISYRNDYVDDSGVAKIFVDKVNAHRKYPIPDNMLFIESEANSMNATFTIYSKKLSKPQKIAAKIDVSQSGNKTVVNVE